MQSKTKKRHFKKKLIILSIFFGFILSLLVGAFFVISNGIKIKQINLVNLQLTGLYLKLDNKLILKLDTLKIQKSKNSKKMEFHSAIKWFQRSLIAISYFEQIKIEKIILPNQEEASILYDGKHYNLIFPEVKALFQISQNPSDIDLKIQKLNLEKFNLQFNGRIQYLTLKNKINFSLIASIPKHSSQEKLIIKGVSNLKTINLSAFSTPVAKKTLMLYEQEFKKIPALYDWLLQKATFDTLRIKNLFFEAPLDSAFKEKLLKSLYAQIDISNVALTLKPQLPPILTNDLQVKFKNNRLSFNLLNQPSYDNISLEGSSVELHNLGKNLETIVLLKSPNAMLDERIHKILQAYDIDFDVTQMDSFLNLDLKLYFQKHDEELQIKAQGIFKAQDSHLDLFGTPIYAKTLNVVLDIDKDKRHIFINDSKALLQTPLIEGLLNCDIDLSQKTLKGKINIDQIKITSDENSNSKMANIFTLTEKEMRQIPIEVDFKNAPIIKIPTFNLLINLDENKTILIEDFAKIYPYSPLLQYLMIQEGQAKIQTKDFQSYFIQTQIHNLQYPIFDKEWKAIKDFNATIKITPQSIFAQSLDKNIKLLYEGQMLKATIADTNFDLLELKKINPPFLKKETPQTPAPTQTSPKKDSKTIIYAEIKQSTLKFNDFLIPTDEIIINFKDEKPTIDITYKNGVANLDFYDDVIHFRLNNFSGDFINTIMKKEIVKGGLFGAKGIYKNKILKADLEIQNTIFKNFAALQNIIGLIDTIPSLIVFKKPGLGADGYQVNQGRVVLEVNSEYLGLKKIDLIGSTIDIGGGGIITLATKELNVSLTISTIKGLSEVLSKIPIVGYLLLGKEGKISTSMILKGTLENPKSEVTIAEDLISAPFKIIQRIFTLD